MSNLQTALERALPIVAAAYGEQFGVKVVLSGTEAHTDGETIVLPMLDSMTELKDVLFGYLAHEASHVRDSNFGTIEKCRSQLEKSFLNIIEDIRIEQLIQDVFPGTQFTLDAMWAHIVEQGISPPARPEDNEGTQLHQYLLHRLRAEELNRESSRSLADTSQQVVEQTFPPGFFVRLDGLLGKNMGNLTCTDECLTLARAILKALEDAEEEERQKEQQKEGQSSEDGQPQDADNSGSDSQDSSQSGSDQPEPFDGQANQGQEGSQQSSSDGGSGNQESSFNPGDQPSSTQSDQGQPDSGGDKSGGNGASLHEKLINESDLPGDAVEQLRGQLQAQACDDNDGKNIKIDTSSVGGDAHNQGETGSLQAGILASSTIRSRLIGLLQAQTRQKQWLHHRGKRVDGKRLTRLASGDSRVFIQRDELKRPDTSVHVLLDTSGSMGGIQDIANQATVSLAMAMSSIPQCDIAVSMFPGVGGQVSPMVHRGQPVRASLERFAVTSSGGTPLAEAMLYAARELAVSKHQRRVLIIITDGAPQNPGAVHYLNDLIGGHVDTYAIGIDSTAVSQYFDNWSVISDVKELQRALFTIAGKFLDLH